MDKASAAGVPEDNRPPFRVKRLGVLLRLHRKSSYIKRIFQQIRKLKVRTHITISLDRPSAAVSTEVNKAIRNLPDRITADCWEPPSPIVTASSQNWMLGLACQYTQLLTQLDAQAVLVWDDDMLFTEDGLREIRGHLHDMMYDRYDVLSVFFWDNPNTINLKMLKHPHWSSVLFRVYPGDVYPTNYVVHCPERVAKSPHVCRLAHPARNYGYLSQTDREEAWRTSKLMGRIDGFTQFFVDSPDPLPWTDQSVVELAGVLNDRSKQPAAALPS